MEIDVEEYRALKKLEAKMTLLEIGGVDNWEWYGASLHEGEETLEQAEKRVDREIELKLKEKP